MKYSKDLKFTIKSPRGRILLETIATFGDKERPFPKDPHNDHTLTRAFNQFAHDLFDKHFSISISDDTEFTKITKMNKKELKEVGEVITNEEIITLLQRVARETTDWTQPSRLNKNCTKGATWNILCAEFNPDNNGVIQKMNIVREFKEFLPQYIIDRYAKPTKKEPTEPYHAEPLNLNRFLK